VILDTCIVDEVINIKNTVRVIGRVFNNLRLFTFE